MLRKTTRILMVILLVAAPFLTVYVYGRLSALPGSVRIATGPEGGRYRVLMEQLGNRIRSELNITPEYVATDGSVDNLSRLEQGTVELALCQSGDHSDEHDSSTTVAFVSNMYSEVTHFLVRIGSGIDAPSDLVGKRVAVGSRSGKSLTAGQLLLRHFGIAPDQLDQDSLDLTYEQIQSRFRAGELDAAFIQSGLRMPIVHDLVTSGVCSYRPIPNPDAFVLRNVSYSNYTIPAGYHRSGDEPLPAADIPTVAVRAQLITKSDMHSGLVEQIVRIIHSQRFVNENGLGELFTGGHDFALEKAEFPLHVGAENYFSPELKPFVNPDFVEATEGARSLLVSVLIGAFVIYRWLADHRARGQEHRLDRYLHQLLEMEQAQVDLDSDSSRDDIDRLQASLDEVTRLRQEALLEFSAHQLNEDRSIDCFLEMSHALSAKISEKLTRQRLERSISSTLPIARRNVSGE